MSDAQMIRNYRSRSLWLDSALEGQSIRPSLDESIRADVVIVGGGMTGIWTAYTLAVEAPELSVVVVEREIVGFGASGRNGSWLTHDLPGSPKVYAKERGWDSVRAAAAECRNAISEVGRVVEEESIDCAFTHAGTLWYAADEPQAQRLSGYLGMLDKYGLAGPGDIRLTGEEVQQRVAVARSEMGHYSPHCASANPARLVRGVAEAAERRGVRIFENTAVTELQQGRVVTEGGTVEADEIVLATEAWTPQLPGYRLTSLPLSSMMVATEPLPAETWEKIGWPRGLTVRDKAHLFLYAVRTEDDRIAIGGSGSPYRLSNPYEEFGERDQPVWDRIRRTIYQQFPAADGAAITHRWGGLLGVPRDWSMGIRRNQEMRITQAGGYAGHGVTATNISGRTIADLLLGRDTELTRLPWVNHRLRRWEPEPARYFAANSIVKLLGSADRHEKEHAKSAKRVSLVKPFMPPG